MKRILLMVAVLGCVAANAQTYYMARVDYQHRLDRPRYSYQTPDGTELNSAETATPAGVGVYEHSTTTFGNAFTFSQEAGLSIHRATYQLPTIRFKQQYFLMEGRVLMGKSFWNDVLNVHAGPSVSIRLTDNGMGNYDDNDANKWLWFGVATGVQLHFSGLFLTARYNYYFNNINARYDKPGDNNTILIRGHLSYLTLGLGIELNRN